jgi:tetratricopeptide (TPR) repeat protein
VASASTAVGSAKDGVATVQEKELTAQQWFERGFAAADVDERLRFYTEAIRLKPDYADAFNNRGNARQEKGDLGGALHDYTEAIRLKPDYAAAFNNRGKARSAKGDLDGALQDYTEAIRLKKGERR